MPAGSQPTTLSRNRRPGAVSRNTPAASASAPPTSTCTTACCPTTAPATRTTMSPPTSTVASTVVMRSSSVAAMTSCRCVRNRHRPVMRRASTPIELGRKVPSALAASWILNNRRKVTRTPPVSSNACHLMFRISRSQITSSTTTADQPGLTLRSAGSTACQSTNQMSRPANKSVTANWSIRMPLRAGVGEGITGVTGSITLRRETVAGALGRGRHPACAPWQAA